MSSFTPVATPKPKGNKIIIHDFTAQDASGKHFWYLFGVDPARSDEFMVAIKSQRDKGLDLDQYGKVLASGEGTSVPESTRKEVYAKYAVAS